MRQIKGAKAFVTVGSADKLQLCVARLGAVGGAMRHEGAWIEKLKAEPSLQGAVDVVLDPVASNYAEQNLEALAVDGRWVHPLAVLASDWPRMRARAPPAHSHTAPSSFRSLHLIALDCA